MTIRYKPTYEYKKEEIEAAQQEYNNALNRPWIQRKRGIPHDWVLAPLVLLGLVSMLFVPTLWFSYFNLPWNNLVALFIIGLSYLLIAWLPEQIYGVKTRSTRYVFWKYSGIRRAIHGFQESGEKFRKHLPVLIIGDKKYFLVNYYYPRDLKKYGFQKRIGIVLLNEAMQVVDNDELFKKLFRIENFSFVMGAAERDKDIKYVRSKYYLINKLKQCEKILARSKDRFERQGVGALWSQLMASFPTLQAAVDESPAILGPIHEKVRKALGYSFALEFLYEDALLLTEISDAFVRYMNAKYRLSLLTAKGNGSLLIVSVIAEQKKEDRNVLLALKQMEAIEEGVLAIIDRFEHEGVVQEEDWEYYHRKVELAKKIGWPIAKE
ncbi:MAG: hypothetical protein JNM55_08590 [Anaerolineales bacterium]|nr:hypothetical protein [Anaerolineales bacterium]